MYCNLDFNMDFESIEAANHFQYLNEGNNFEYIEADNNFDMAEVKQSKLEYKSNNDL